MHPFLKDFLSSYHPKFEMLKNRMARASHALDEHYQRKENQLFSALERHDVTGPSTAIRSLDGARRLLQWQSE